jgi:hypothetical protein
MDSTAAHTYQLLSHEWSEIVYVTPRSQVSDQTMWPYSTLTYQSHFLHWTWPLLHVLLWFWTTCVKNYSFINLPPALRSKNLQPCFIFLLKGLNVKMLNWFLFVFKYVTLVEHGGEVKTPYKILVSQRKTTFEKSGCKWEDNIKMEYEYVEYTEPIQHIFMVVSWWIT